MKSSPEDAPVALSVRQDQSQKMREMIMLPKDFEPSEMDVVIGRGKKARTHEGNNRLRGLIEFMIPEYSAAGSNKDEKSYIIKEIVTQIRKSSPDGGFVKFDKSKNRWFEVGDFLAREKISQTFRDCMGEAYSSSNPYKRKRRSFEKKHHAIMDTIKHRRGSSPTSVAQTGSASPPSPPPMESTSSSIETLAVSSVAPSPPLSPSHQNPSLVDLYKRPGQIGFARRSMMQLGMQAPSMYPAMQMPRVRAPGMMPMGRSVPHHFAAMASLPRRASMPGAIYSSALMVDVMQRQRLAHNAAMLRRSSAPQEM